MAFSIKSCFKQANICNLYLLLWVIYALHWTGAQIPAVEAISNYVLGLNLLISIWFFLIANYRYRLPSFFKTTNVLLILFCIYGIYYIIYGPQQYLFGMPVKRGSYLLAVLRSLLPIYTFFVFTKKGYLTESTIRFWSLIFLLEFVFVFFNSLQLRALVSSETDFVNNTGYLFAVALPCVFFWKKYPLLQFAYLCICFLFILLCLKRGAMLTGFCVIWLFFYYKFKNTKRNLKIFMILFIVCSVFVGYTVIEDRVQESELFQERIQSTLEGNSSQRDILAQDFINHYLNKSDFSQQLFGHGADATLSISYNYAHNDWLEILICQGFLGFVCYLSFWITFLRSWVKSNRGISREIIGSYFMIYSIRTLISMSYAMILSVASMSIGYALAVDQKTSLDKKIGK